MTDRVQNDLPSTTEPGAGGLGPVGIRDVAHAARVSVTTVSHVFSGRRPVAKATGARVREVADRLGYLPHGGARSLGAGRSTTIALDIQAMGDALILNPYFGAVISALSAAAVARGFTFMLLPPEGPRGVRLSRSSLAGAIVVEPSPSNRWLRRLITAGVPVVTIGRPPAGIREASWVDHEHRASAEAAVEHLVRDQGYGRIALLTSRERFSLMVDLEAGVADAAHRLGVPWRVVQLDLLTEAEAARAAAALLAGDEPPDAFIAAIDRVALGVLEAARARGLGVPEDVGIVGGGDTVLSRNAHPRLSSVRTAPEELGRIAVELVQRHWAQGDVPPDCVSLPARLVIRASSRRWLRQRSMARVSARRPPAARP